MGLWDKMRGVCGRIHGGIKKGFNWLKNHMDTITDIADKAQGFVPEQYRGAYNDTFNKFKGGMDKFSQIVN